MELTSSIYTQCGRSIRKLSGGPEIMASGSEPEFFLHSPLKAPPEEVPGALGGSHFFIINVALYM